MDVVLARKTPRRRIKTQQDAEKFRQQKKTVIWFVLFVWLNQTDQMNQINNQFEHPVDSCPVDPDIPTIGFPTGQTRCSAACQSAE
jgi:hypothetical protein